MSGSEKILSVSTAGESISFQELLAAMKECSRTGNLEKGKKVHAKAIECGHGCNIYVANTLINMYAKCGSMVGACEVFENMKQLTAVSWTMLILGYATNGQGQSALHIFTRMRSEGTEPDPVTLVAALKACTCLAMKEEAYIERGKQIHNIAVENLCNSDVYVQSTLVDMYAKYGRMIFAREVFDSMKHPNIVSWTVLILGYADNGEGHTALELFGRMKSGGPTTDSIALMAALKACTALAVKEGESRWSDCRDRGKGIHSLAVESICNSSVYVQSTLVDMYVKCGSMVDACEVFDGMRHPDVVSWTELIMGYVENGQAHAALDMFTKMKTQGPTPDSVSFVAALKACTSLAMKGASKWAESKAIGKEIHNFAVECGCIEGIYVQSSLIDMYAKCGSMVDAREVFDCMKQTNVVSWTALILGYADNGQGHMALELFNRMKNKGPAPNFLTFAIALKACSLVGALEYGRTIHLELVNGNNVDVVLVNCLVDLYAKCGSLVEAQSVFDSHAEIRNLITWNALLAGFSSSGDSEAVFEMFERMQDAGFKPDGITFSCILTCCSHAGLVVKGKEFFDAMSIKYGVTPTLEHYSSMIDIFGRANKLDDAIALLECMPCSPDIVTWRTIWGACRKWKNVEIGRRALRALIDLNDKTVAAFVDTWE